MDLLQQLKAMEDIRQLKARYFRFLDTKDWDGYGSVFCKDATFDLRASTAVDPDDGSDLAAISADMVLQGRQKIVDVVRAAVGTNITVHHGHCHEVWIDGPSDARGVIAMVDKIVTAQGHAPVLEGYGHYHEHYRMEDGEWRIATSRLSRLRVTMPPPAA